MGKKPRGKGTCAKRPERSQSVRPCEVEDSHDPEQSSVRELSEAAAAQPVPEPAEEARLVAPGADMREARAAERDVSAGEAVLGPSRLFYPVLLGILLLSLGLGLLVGRGGLEPALLETFLGMRTHRVAVAFLCGAGLAMSGAVVQALFRNPLANPSILGVNAGATLGAHVALLGAVIWFSGSRVLGFAPEMLAPIGAVLGAGLAMFVLLVVASRRTSPLALLLTGFALMCLLQAISTGLTALTQQSWELNRAISALQNGSIGSVGVKQVWLACVMVLGAALPLYLWSGSLDLLLCGEEEAEALGVNVSQVRRFLVLWVCVQVAGCIAVGGGVGFVDVIAPHAMRRFVGHSYRHLLLASALGGGTFVVLCDVLCRVLPTPGEVPLSIVTSLVGAPLFLRLLLKATRGEGAP